MELILTAIVVLEVIALLILFPMLNRRIKAVRIARQKHEAIIVNFAKSSHPLPFESRRERRVNRVC